MKVLVAQFCPTLCDPMDCCSWASCPCSSPDKNTRVDSQSLLQGIFTIWATMVNSDLLSFWVNHGLKIKNTGASSHSLLQGIFVTLSSNLGLLHCRRLLYHLSHEGSPINDKILLYSTGNYIQWWAGNSRRGIFHDIPIEMWCYVLTIY